MLYWPASTRSMANPLKETSLCDLRGGFVPRMPFRKSHALCASPAFFPITLCMSLSIDLSIYRSIFLYFLLAFFLNFVLFLFFSFFLSLCLSLDVLRSICSSVSPCLYPSPSPSLPHGYLSVSVSVASPSGPRAVCFYVHAYRSASLSLAHHVAPCWEPSLVAEARRTTCPSTPEKQVLLPETQAPCKRQQHMQFPPQSPFQDSGSGSRIYAKYCFGKIWTTSFGIQPSITRGKKKPTTKSQVVCLEICA